MLGSYCKSLSSDVLNGTVLLLAVLSYNVGTGRLLGYGKHPKSRLLRKIESGDRNFYREFVSFCRYKGKVLRGLVKRRKVEFALFYVP
ncbi:lysozyme [Prevotella intermedia]|nr:lysozyme [Prevotella intermedia]